MAKKIKVTDTTLRDAHQSNIATRLRFEDMEKIAPILDKVGFHAVEMWGGATFDVAHRFLKEDPWERVERLKELMPNTPFQMLLRGQNLVGYRHYPDDVVEAFIEEACAVGIDIFRVFDALNDERNLEKSFKEIKKHGKHVQGAICYSLTQRRLGGDVYNIDYYVKKSKILYDMGADSICIKDMAGLLSPLDAYELVKAIKEAVPLPLELHTHYTSGMASMTYLKAIEAGVDIIDTTIGPLGMRFAQPCIEPFLAALHGTEYYPDLDEDAIFQVGDMLEDILKKYTDVLSTGRVAQIDTRVIRHQIPGGMISNLVAQLRQANALDRLREVEEEIPITREELGCPPLVTPSSQIVGSQAVLNVLFGRYTYVTNQTRDYVYGLYGRPPKPIREDIVKKILKGYPRGEKPIDCRPADLLEPEMEKAFEATKGIAKNRRDVLIYALFPTTGMEFLKYKYGIKD